MHGTQTYLRHQHHHHRPLFHPMRGPSRAEMNNPYSVASVVVVVASSTRTILQLFLYFLGLMMILSSQSLTAAFVVVPKKSPITTRTISQQQQQQFPSATTTTTTTTTTTQLFMVFDFFKKRSEEGMEQLSKLSDAAVKGNLGRGLAEAASYTTSTNRAFADGLAKSRNRFLNNLESLFANGRFGLTLSGDGEELLEELQDVLLQADLGMATAEDIVKEVRSLRADSGKVLSREDLMSIMRGKLIETLVFESGPEDDRLSDEASGAPNDDDVTRTPSSFSAGAIRFASPEERAMKVPTTLFIMGANGMGKTTTIGKLAHRLRVEGNQTVLMASCDTFRAGAVEQLQQWADRAEVDLYGPSEQKRTPAAVLFGALDHAVRGGYDTVLVDTSGRLSNNNALTQELVKMKRVIQKRFSKEIDDNGKPILNPHVPHETLLVLDAAQGRMALDSARVWNKEIGLTGLILTKLDGSARGGSVVAISRELNLPVKLIGVGEQIEDLRDFEPEKFVDGLLGIGAAGGKSSSSSEGAMLASRLEALRKERADRAPIVTTQTQKEPAIAAVAQGGVRQGPFPSGPPPPSTNRNMGSKRRERRKKGKR